MTVYQFLEENELPSTLMMSDDKTPIHLDVIIEAYHKDKVESITDEEIDNKSEELYPYEKYMEDHLYGMHEGFKEGAKWLKSQLLK